MAELKQLVCPSCGAKLKITGDEVQVTCDYCGNAIVVPEELRNKKSEADPTAPLVQALKDLQSQRPVVVVQPPVQRVFVPGETVYRSRSTNWVGCFITLVVLAVTLGGILVSMPLSALGQLTSLVPG